ncbi:beta strand repeat-containing protein [Ekhidna sp.]
MKHQIIRFSAIALLLLSVTTFAQSVGIGTETPNANAILELVAPNGDQGLLVPRMNTSARTASTFTNNLSPTDNGLLVFDEEENKFYFWMTDQWVEMASGNLESLPDQTGQSNKYLTTDGTNALWANIDFTSLSNIPTGLSDGDNDTQLSDTDIEALGYIKSADDADADSSNEIQDLTLSGNTLSLTSSTVGVDLSPFSGTNTDNQTMSLTGSNLTISGGNTIDISGVNTVLTEAEVDVFANNNGYLLVEVDGSTTNEVNTGMSLSGTTIQVTDANSTQGVNIDGTFATDSELAASDAADDDKDASNEIQDISTNGSAGNISLSSGATLNLNVDDADADDTNEFQTISKTGNTVTLSNSGGSFSVDDDDSSTSNEIQDISTNGSAGNISLSSGATLNLNVDDTDADNTNEFQDLSLSGSTLSLSNSSETIDLSPFSGTNTDNQTLGLSGSNLSITGGNTIDISSIDTQLSEAVVDGYANNNGYLLAEVDGSTTNEVNTGMSLSGTTISVSDANSTQSVNIGGTFATDAELASSDAADGDKSASNEIQDISTNGTSGNITLSSGSTLNLNVNDADADDSNEFQTVSKTGTTVTLSDGGGSFSVADNDNSTSNEIQNISTNGTAGNITLSSGSTLNLNVNDGDADDSNEFQTVSKTGTTVTLSNGGGSFSVADNDNSSSNEYNSGMSLSGTSIRVTDGGGTRSVNIGGTFATDAELDSRTFSPSAFKATMKAGNIPVGVTNLTFETEAYDIDGSYDASSGVFTVPEDGLYNFGGLMIFSNVPSGLVQIVIRDAGSNILLSKVYAPNTIQSSISFSVDLQLKAGDEIGIALSNTTLGGNEAQPIQTIAAPDVSNFFFCAKRFN